MSALPLDGSCDSEQDGRAGIGMCTRMCATRFIHQSNYDFGCVSASVGSWRRPPGPAFGSKEGPHVDASRAQRLAGRGPASTRAGHHGAARRTKVARTDQLSAWWRRGISGRRGERAEAWSDTCSGQGGVKGHSYDPWGGGGAGQKGAARRRRPHTSSNTTRKEIHASSHAENTSDDRG